MTHVYYQWAIVGLGVLVYALFCLVIGLYSRMKQMKEAVNRQAKCITALSALSAGIRADIDKNNICNLKQAKVNLSLIKCLESGRISDELCLECCEQLDEQVAELQLHRDKMLDYYDEFYGMVNRE